MKAFPGPMAFAVFCWVAVQASFGSTPELRFSTIPTTEELLHARVFDEPLAPTGGAPGAAENAALASALVEFSKRATPDDFSSLTAFLQKHPRSAWKPALLTRLGVEYYKAAYYSLALEAWQEAWALGQNAADIPGKFIGDRAVCELAGLYSRLGRMNELETLLKAAEGRAFIGGATERITLAREALWMMQNRPEASFRCGPLALQSILKSDQSLLTTAATNAMMEIFNSASTQQGFSLSQVAKLSEKIGLNYQMAFRSKGGEFVIPSVVHWKAGHYAALVRKADDRYLLEDSTFGNTVWATKRALEAETSGYFLIPPGNLPAGWRRVDAKEAVTIWGKGVTSNNDADNYTPDDLQTGQCGGEAADMGIGMAISSVHLMLANLQIRDTPVGYTPPVGPPVQFTVRYNHRDYLQEATIVGTNAVVSILGPDWTHNWHGRIRDNPGNPLADVKYLVEGGGARTFTGFDTNTQTFAPQQFEQTQLRRIGTNVAATYEMTYPNGSRKIFGLRAGLDVYLTQILDPAGNAVTLGYDSVQRLATITDAIGQVTTISYDGPGKSNLVTRVTDPFGRFATFEYNTNLIGGYVFRGTCGTNLTVEPILIPRLVRITDVLGLTSSVAYEAKTTTRIAYDPLVNEWCTNDYSYTGDTIISLNTPYGGTFFTTGNGPATNFTMRFVETRYPDGSRDRVAYNQSEHPGVLASEPPATVPQGMGTWNSFLYARNTYYWSRNAAATAYGDYTKAKIYHWLHAANLTSTSGILESTKEPLERRVWYDYAGQPGAYGVGNTDKPTHIGRVLDDGTTQRYTYSYNSFGNVTRTVDPVGRTLSYLYDSNGIDLLEIRQTRAGNNELLFKATYNTQHLPLTIVDAAGQTNTYTYNARGQILTSTNPRNEMARYSYDADGYLIAVDRELAGTNDVLTATYDSFGRIRTITDESGYTMTFDYDALNRLTRLTHPDATYSEFTYDRLDLVDIRDRDGRHTSLEYDNVRQIKKQTDALGRVTRFLWCQCGSIKSLIDPMGRTTEWHSDVQGRLISKQYADGSRISYSYENTTSRLKQVVDERQQASYYQYHRDDTLSSVTYANSVIPTPGVSYAYDTNYQRVVSMTDGGGTTLYWYHPMTGAPTPGAGQLAGIDGPLPDDTITYSYDASGRRTARAINGVASTFAYDAGGRLVAETNELGAFAYVYDGGSDRLASQAFPNGQSMELTYGNNLEDHTLKKMTHRRGAAPISEFIYGRDIAAGRIVTWSQQAGTQPPLLHTFLYDAVNQVVSATGTNAGALVNLFSYSYDLVGNRLTEQLGTTDHAATYNALNQISARSAPGSSRTNEWDAQDRLVAVNAGNQRTEFSYDGLSRLQSIRHLTNGVEASLRRFVWCGSDIYEERDAVGAVTKRFFHQGMKVETGPNAGSYFYTRDHLGSIREVTDAAGNVRARYAYDPYGRRTLSSGDVEADFGFAGMFWSSEARLSITHYRAYDPELGRWLSRDPLEDAEIKEGPNLYAYVGNNPVNLIDPYGLMSTLKTCFTPANAAACSAAGILGARIAEQISRAGPRIQMIGQGVQGGACNWLPRMPTLPGIGPDTINVLANTAPAIQTVSQTLPGIGPFLPRVIPPLRDMAIQARRAEAWANSLIGGNGFWQNWVEASRHWRDLLSREEAREALMWISRWADVLY